MKKVLVVFLTFVILTGLIVTPALAKMPTGQTTDRVPPTFETTMRPEPKLVPQEIQDLFKDGLSVEEFLAMNKGPVPNAVMAYANLPITVIVQLEGPSLIAYMDNQKGINGIEADKQVQQSYVAQLESTQDSVINQITTSGIDAIVMGRYTKVLNGFMARVPFNDIETIRRLPGVKSVSKAPEHTIDLSVSVPLIGADLVHQMGTGYTGEAIRVAVIDTGIDYTHAMFGTLGDPAAYATNDPNIVEEGSFPTPKVVGGYDFAGTDYDASASAIDEPARLIPVPDPDPLDEGGHGTHVASTVAGVDAGFGTGVAPDALLYALKVFGAEGSTNLVVDAIEWAIDPNGDGFIDDHVDVINMSLGSSFGPAIPDDPEYLAVEAANTAGVFVVASSGNAGDVNYVTGSPANTDSALSVASSTTGFMTAPFLTYEGGEIPYTTSYNPFVTAISAELVDVTTLGDDGKLCDATGVSALTGKIALISRGNCSFYVKINNAESLGAVAAIIYNNTDGTINMDTAGSTLPAGSILQSEGEMLKGLAPIDVVVGPDSNVKTFVSPVAKDTISDFSSRGPRGYDSMLKPEISAPGTAIFAANMGSGNQGVSMSGTSMAAPHVAGVVALMKQAHPNWTNQQIKAALMNTAVDLGDDIPRQGAGRVDALAAVTTKVVAFADPKLVSLNWGLLELTEDSFTSEKAVTLRNFSDAPITLNLAATFTSASSAGATLVPDPSSVTISAFGRATVNLSLTLDVTQLPIGFGEMEEYFGYVNVTGSDTNIHLPFYFVPRPYPVINETVSQTSFNVAFSGSVDLEQTGPVASSLWAYPTTMVSTNDPIVLDMGDLRYVGLDYGWLDEDEGDIFVAAFNMWGAQHSNQPYWSEVDFYVYGDEAAPVVNFNYNLGAFTSDYPDNTWIVLQLDYNVGEFYVSPYLIYADFNSGFQEWYLPASWNYVTDIFVYDVMSYDWYGNEDYLGSKQFDITNPPLWWDITDLTQSNSFLDPHNTDFKLSFGVTDLDVYNESEILGVMLVDYVGKPGIGQAMYWPLEISDDPISNLYLPIISR